jgi:hypothetical protein
MAMVARSSLDRDIQLGYLVNYRDFQLSEFWALAEIM